MRYLLLILLIGCYTSKKAEKALDKAYRKHPEVAAKKAQRWFPVKSDSVELVKWRLQVDSIFNDSIIVSDNCKDSVISKNVMIEKIRYKVRNMPAIYRIDSAYIYTKEKLLQDTIKAKDKAETKADIYFKVLACIFGLIVLFLVAYFIKK